MPPLTPTNQHLHRLTQHALEAVAKAEAALVQLREHGSGGDCNCGRFGWPGLCPHHAEVFNHLTLAHSRLTFAQQTLANPNGRPQPAAPAEGAKP